MKLDRIARTVATAVVVSGGLIWGAGAQAAEPEPVRWRMQVAYPASLTVIGTPSAWIPEKISAMTDGSFQVRAYEPGKLVPTFDILEAVSDGKIQAGYTWAGYDQGSIPAIALFSAVPFGMKPWEFMAWFYFHDGQQMMQEVYHEAGYNVHPELCGMISAETAGWYHEPIEGVEAYDGMKIRFAGLGGEVLARLGAAVSLIPVGQIFQALETGVIDATEFSMPVVDQIIGFQQLVKYNLFPGWHQPYSGDYLLINQDAWEALSDSQRQIVNVACMASTAYTMAEGEAKNPPVLKELQKQGVHIGQIPRPVLEKLKKVTYEVMAEMAAESPAFKRVWESQKAFMEAYNLWEKRAYLPPEL